MGIVSEIKDAAKYTVNFYKDIIAPSSQEVKVKGSKPRAASNQQPKADEGITGKDVLRAMLWTATLPLHIFTGCGADTFKQAPDEVEEVPSGKGEPKRCMETFYILSEEDIPGYEAGSVVIGLDEFNSPIVIGRNDPAASFPVKLKSVTVVDNKPKDKNNPIIHSCSYNPPVEITAISNPGHQAIDISAYHDGELDISVNVEYLGVPYRHVNDENYVYSGRPMVNVRTSKDPLPVQQAAESGEPVLHQVRQLDSNDVVPGLDPEISFSRDYTFSSTDMKYGKGVILDIGLQNWEVNPNLSPNGFGLTGVIKYDCETYSEPITGFIPRTSIQQADTTLSAPVGLLVGDVGDTWAVLHWDPAEGADNYIVSYSTNITFPVDVTAIVSGTSTMVSSLTPVSTYYARIKAENNAGYSSNYSNPVTFMTLSEEYPEPVTLRDEVIVNPDDEEPVVPPDTPGPETPPPPPATCDEPWGVIGPGLNTFMITAENITPGCPVTFYVEGNLMFNPFPNSIKASVFSSNGAVHSSLSGDTGKGMWLFNGGNPVYGLPVYILDQAAYDNNAADPNTPVDYMDIVDTELPNAATTSVNLYTYMPAGSFEDNNGINVTVKFLMSIPAGYLYGPSSNFIPPEGEYKFEMNNDLTPNFE